MVTLVILGILAAVVALIVGITTGKDRYAKMTEQEFEDEAKRTSAVGAAVAEFHKFFQPKRVEYTLQRDKRVEGDSAEAGEPPPKEPPVR